MDGPGHVEWHVNASDTGATVTPATPTDSVPLIVNLPATPSDKRVVKATTTDGTWTPPLEHQYSPASAGS